VTTTHDDTKAQQKPPRRLRSLGRAIDWWFDRIQAEYIRGAPPARATLAKLRRALGKPAGSVPEVWEHTIAVVPRSLSWDRDEPSPAEQATHAAMTLYALHQQSMSTPAHVPGTSFGRAVGNLARAEGPSEAAVTRRFMAVATASSIDEILTHIRGLVTQLRGAGQGFDYARFADDVHDLLNPWSAQAVRLAWSRDFYRIDNAPSGDATADTEADSHDTEE